MVISQHSNARSSGARAVDGSNPIERSYQATVETVSTFADVSKRLMSLSLDPVGQSLRFLAEVQRSALDTVARFGALGANPFLSAFGGPSGQIRRGSAPTASAIGAANEAITGRSQPALQAGAPIKRPAATRPAATKAKPARATAPATKTKPARTKAAAAKRPAVTKPAATKRPRPTASKAAAAVKPAATKAAATKSAAKRTTTAKPVAKRTTTAKPVAARKVGSKPSPARSTRAAAAKKTGASKQA